VPVSPAHTLGHRRERAMVRRRPGETRDQPCSVNSLGSGLSCPDFATVRGTGLILTWPHSEQTERSRPGPIR